ncbi:hypothetical protein BBG19_1625 [Francisella sp. MA067296]|nr:hypothetical protein BBG19_1625 [Francisella sp. MA067296]
MQNQLALRYRNNEKMENKNLLCLNSFIFYNGVIDIVNR